MLQGNLRDLPDTLGELGCLPLAERAIRLGSARASLMPLVVLAVAMALVAFNVRAGRRSPFSAPRVLLVLFGSLTLREAYETIEWPILVMLGALIPVSEAIRTTGGTDLIAGWLSIGRHHAAADRGARADHGRRHGGDAVPQQCRDRAGDGADRRELRDPARAPSPTPS